jgi:hypothetical protein
VSVYSATFDIYSPSNVYIDLLIALLPARLYHWGVERAMSAPVILVNTINNDYGQRDAVEEAAMERDLEQASRPVAWERAVA